MRPIDDARGVELIRQAIPGPMKVLLHTLALGLLGALAEAAGTVTTGTVDAPDGVPLAFDVRGAGEPVLVFIHGWACDRGYWREQLDVFARDHRVVSLDLAGHGESGAARSTWSLDGLASDLVAVVEALDLRRVVLVGHSMGGSVALIAAPRLRERLLGIVGVDMLHDPKMVPTAEMMAPLLSRFESDYPGTMAAMVEGAFPKDGEPSVRDWIVGRARASNREAAIGLMRGFIGFDRAPLAAKAGVPLRAINAKPPRAPETKAAGWKALADFDVTFIEDAGHFLMLEKPEPFNARLTEALSGLSRPGSEAEGPPRPRPLAVPTAEEIAAGQRLFAAQCTRCHGQDGAGGSGPSLRVPRLRRAPDDAALVAVIMDGVPGTAMAAAWQLSDPEVVLVAAYVRSLGHRTMEVVAGDAARGRAIYEGKGGCAACHIVGGKGSGVGPELSDVGARRGAQHLRQSLLEPGADFPHRTVPYEPTAYSGYRLVRAVPTTGAPVVGFAVNEDTFTLQLRDASGALHSLRKADLARVEKDTSASTLMPSYKAVLTEGEIQDLVAFLASLRGEP